MHLHLTFWGNSKVFNAEFQQKEASKEKQRAALEQFQSHTWISTEHTTANTADEDHISRLSIRRNRVAFFLFP